MKERKKVLYSCDYDNMQIIDDVTLISTKVHKNSWENKERDKLQISTPIALFTTAYARILMSEYKIKYQDNLYYSDTDSLILDCKLPENKVGKELGLFKLEYQIDEAVFISPKVYVLNLKDGTQVLKVKGLSDQTKENKEKLSLKNLKALLDNNNSNSINLENSKWFRHLDQGYISIKDNGYTISINENKRNFVKDNDENIINTKPFNINNTEIEAEIEKMVTAHLLATIK